MNEAAVEFTLLRLARHHERIARFSSLQGPGSVGKHESSLLLHSAVALRAVLVQQRLDIPSEIDGCGQTVPRGGQCQRGQEKELAEWLQTGTLNFPMKNGDFL